MSESTWTINTDTLQRTAGTGLQSGFTGYRNKLTGKLEAKINVDGPVLTVDVAKVQQEVVDRATEMIREIPEQEQIAEMKQGMAEARKLLEHLSWLREELLRAEKELNSFQDYSRKDAGAQLVTLKKRVEELKREIAGIEQNNPNEVIRTLQGRLAMMPEILVTIAKSKVIPAAIKESTAKLLAKRNELLKQLEQACAPLLNELAMTDIQYHKLICDQNLPFTVEQKIKEAVDPEATARASMAVVSPPVCIGGVAGERSKVEWKSNARSSVGVARIA